MTASSRRNQLPVSPRWHMRRAIAIVAEMRLAMFPTIALLLTLTAWGNDVLHMMHMGAAETLAEHDAATGNEEPDAPHDDGAQ